MHKFNKINDELELTHGLKSLAQAYEEISVMKMQEVRGSVLANRNFLTDIAQVFTNVKSSYKHQIEALAKKMKKGSSLSTSTIPKNGKTVIVLLSANNKLYGDIIPKTFRAFLEAVKKESADIVVVGHLGRSLYEQQDVKKTYSFYELPDTQISADELKKVIDMLIQYDNVEVFYGKFENVVSQVPQKTIVSGDGEIASQNPTENFKFFFEPSLEDVLHFFETQIFTSLFKQTVHENQLARYASRITAMEQALQNIHSHIGYLQRKQKRADNIFENRKQLAALAGISLWNTSKNRKRDLRAKI